MNCIYACNRNLPHHFSSLSLSLSISVTALLLCGYWLSKQSVPKDIYHNQYTTAASSCGPWPQPQHRHWLTGWRKRKGMSRSHCCRQWTRVRSRISISVYLWFPVQFSVLTRIIEQRGCGKLARKSCAHFTHKLSLSASLSLSLSPTVLLHVAIRA